MIDIIVKKKVIDMYRKYQNIKS